MSRPFRPLPDSLGDVFSVPAAQRAGVSVRRLRGWDLEAPFHAVRARPLSPAPVPDTGRSPLAVEAEQRRADILHRARAYATVSSPHSFFTSITAAVVWDLPLPIRALRGPMPPDAPRGAPWSALPRAIDVGTLAPRRATRAAGTIGRQFRGPLIATRERDGLRIASPATVWAQLAADLTVDDLIRLGDAIVNIPRRRGMERGAPADALATVDQLRTAMTAGRRPGAAKLREAIAQIRVGSASAAETDLRLACVRGGLPEPDLDVDLIGVDGRPIGYTELAFTRYRVPVEYEGDYHRVDRDRWNRDIDKYAAARAAGWDPVRITSRHLYPTPHRALMLIREALVRAGWRP